MLFLNSTKQLNGGGGGAAGKSESAHHCHIEMHIYRFIPGRTVHDLSSCSRTVDIVRYDSPPQNPL